MRWGISAALACVVLSLLGAGAAQAAAPANDDFAAAIPIALGEEVSGSNSGATAQTGEPDPKEKAELKGESHGWFCTTPDGGPQCSSSVWYTWEVAETGEYTIETCDGGTELGTALGVYTGSTLGALTPVAEDISASLPFCPGGSDNGSDGSRVSFEAIAGTRYDVYVGGYRGDMGSFWLRSYFGAAKARPQPDTNVAARNSVANTLHAFSAAPALSSGPRHTPSLSIETEPPELPLQCSIDGAEFTPCAAAVSYDDLAPGPHVLRARAASGGFVDSTPLVHRFTVDTTPPQTTLTSGPTGGETISTQEAAWEFESSERTHENATGACRVDAEPMSRCGGGKTTVTELCHGPHSFEAAAVDEAANIDPTPVLAKIQVPLGSPCAAPTVKTPPSPPASATETAFQVEFESKGAGGSLEVAYGPTTAYGQRYGPIRIDPSEKPDEEKIVLSAMRPASTYHFQVRLRTPFGTALSADQTVTTKPASGEALVIHNGVPAVAGRYAASVPVTVDTHKQGANLEMLLAAGETVGGPNTGRMFLFQSFASGQETQSRTAPLADLDPSTTYHYRFLSESFSTGDTYEGPEGTFTTPPQPQGAGGVEKKASRFRLSRRNLRLVPLTRRSKRLKLDTKGLPGKSTVKVTLKVGPSKQTARKKANRGGKARFRPTLSKRIRKALHEHSNRRFRLRVTVSPPGDAPSSITLAKKIKR